MNNKIENNFDIVFDAPNWQTITAGSMLLVAILANYDDMLTDKQKNVLKIAHSILITTAAKLEKES